jgi:transcription antitermination factor NusG
MLWENGQYQDGSSDGAAAVVAPPVELPGELPGAAAGLWHVLHTRSRQEKSLADDLAAMSIAHYLPLVNSVRFRGRRKIVLALPLFPGYVFLRGDLDDAYQADRTKRIANIIRVADQQLLDNELRSVAMALRLSAPLRPHPYLVRGITVEVTSGPLRGLRGVIEGWTRSDRLILQVDMLGQAVSVEVDGSLLEPVRGCVVG